MLRYLFILFFISLSACERSALLGPGDEMSLATPSEESCGFIRNVRYGQRVSWKNQIPVSIYIHPDFPKEHIPAIYSAAGKWNQAISTPLIRILQAQASDIDSQEKLNSKNMLLWKNQWDRDKTSLQGVTRVSYLRNQLSRAEISINGVDFQYSSEASAGRVHMESLLVHELGHALGLDHRQDAESVMWSVLNSNVQRDTLQPADIKSLKCEY